MRDLGFKYKPGERVTHVGFLKPMRQPVVPQFHVVAQTLEAMPSGPQRYYSVRSTEEHSQAGTGFRVQEAHLAPLPNDE